MTDSVIDFETAPDIRRWYSSGPTTFWVENAAGDWIEMGQTGFKEFLLGNSHRKLRGFKLELEAQSPLDAEIVETLVNHRLDYVGPLAGWHKGFQQIDRTKVLVSVDPKLMTPVEGCWQTFFEFLSGLLGHDPRQLQSFLYWLKHGLEAMYEGRPRNGMALVLAGEAGCGKTLLKEFIRIMFGGGEVYPYSFMIGRDMFNSELVECPLWVVDDEAADTSLAMRLKFGAEVKKVVANSAMKCRGIHRDGITLTSMKRLVICVNIEPDRLLVLPPIDDDIADKMLICKCVAPAPWPLPMSTHAEKQAFFEAVVRELPAFIHQLLGMDIPADYLGRFGVRHYHHPEVVESLLAISPEMQMAEQIERELFKSFADGVSWKGSPSDLYRRMVGPDSILTAREKDKFPQAAWLGRRLAKLAARFPGRYELQRGHASNVWVVRQASGGEG
jgi:hypothetical protein